MYNNLIFSLFQLILKISQLNLTRFVLFLLAESHKSGENFQFGFPKEYNKALKRKLVFFPQCHGARCRQYERRNDSCMSTLRKVMTRFLTRGAKSVLNCHVFITFLFFSNKLLANLQCSPIPCVSEKSLKLLS